MAPNRHRSHGVLGTDLFHNMFEWMFGNGWDSPGWAFPDSGEGTFKLCSATLGNGTVNGYQSHWYRAGNDCSDTEHFPITWTITFVSSVFNQYTRNGWNEYEGEFAADGDDTVFALASYNTLNGNLAYGNLVDDVSVAAEGGDGGNLVTNSGRRIAIAYQGRRNGPRRRFSQRRNAAARTPHHAADWPHSLTVSVR